MIAPTTDTTVESRKRLFVPMFLAASAVVWASCGHVHNESPDSSRAPRVVTDMSDRRVTVPAVVERIGEQFPAHTVTSIMLGAGDRIAAIPPNVSTLPLLRKIYPRVE